MFRDIRKKKNQISTEAAEQLLREARRGILAVNGREGYPYACLLYTSPSPRDRG